MKVCTKCGKRKLINEFRKRDKFYNGIRKEYHLNYCRYCEVQYAKKYAEENKEKRSITTKKYRKENKEKLSIRMKKYREENKEKILITTKKYREENKEKRLITTKKYYEKNKEKILVTAKKYTEGNKEKRSDYRKKYVEKLNDTYIKSLLTQDSSFQSEDIPQELVEAKREYIKLQRKLKENKI